MQERTIDVVVAGHICLDITPEFDGKNTGSLSDILRPGKLVEVGPPTISSGGTVSNTGLALRRLGLEVSLMGKCGNDPFGEILIDIIRNEAPGAERGMSIISDENTSYSVVIAVPGSDRIFLHCAGANHTFSSEDIDPDIAGRARVFHFGYPPIMRRMYENSGKELAAVLGGARQRGAVTSLDMSLPDPNSDSGRADWRSILSEALPHTCIFMPSIEELMFMLKKKRFDELSAQQGDFTQWITADDLRELAGECIDMGADVVVIKCGALGAYLKSSGSPRRLEPITDSILQWENIEIFEPACTVNNIKSATGAGDNAIAGFLAAFIKGMAPEKCMQTLAIVGAHNLSSVSAVGGVRPWEETLAELNANPPRITPPRRLHGIPPLRI